MGALCLIGIVRNKNQKEQPKKQGSRAKQTRRSSRSLFPFSLQARRPRSIDVRTYVHTNMHSYIQTPNTPTHNLRPPAAAGPDTKRQGTPPRAAHPRGRSAAPRRRKPRRAWPAGAGRRTGSSTGWGASSVPWAGPVRTRAPGGGRTVVDVCVDVDVNNRPGNQPNQTCAPQIIHTQPR